MTTQHTPGPWKDTLPRNAVHPVVKATNKEQTVIAWVQHPADATLISAAPELFDAVKDLLRHLELDMSLMINHNLDIDDTGHIDNCPVCKARAAIQKATGEA